MDIEHFTDEELCVFASDLKVKQEGVLQSYKAFDKCIASALCAAGSKRRRALFCETYVSSIRKSLTKVVCDLLNDEQKQQIVEFCISSTVEKNVYNATIYLGADTVLILEELVPIFMSRQRKLKIPSLSSKSQRILSSCNTLLIALTTLSE